MEVPMEQPFSGSPSASYPRWVLLQPDCETNVEDDDEDSTCSTPADDANTVATSRTTSGHPIQVSFCLAEPPASSRVCLQVKVPDGFDVRYCTAIAAHGDSVLIEVIIIEDPGGYERATIDHFVYSAGAAAAEPPRPPSLSRLPPNCVAENYSGLPYSRELSASSTGLIRHGDDEIVVAELTMDAATGDDAPEMRVEAELFMFRSGEWSVVNLTPIRNGDPEFGELHPRLFTHTVVPFGERLLCWVNLSRGLLLCDVFDESPMLEYVKLPVDPCYGQPSTCRNVCVTGGGRAIKFVNIYPRCCCRGVGANNCQQFHGACTVNTWTLRMDDMEWSKDGMVDVTELWALDAYNGLPRLPLAHPVVSMDESHVICFRIVDVAHDGYGGQIVCKLMIDMRRKMIRSVSYCPEERWDYRDNNLIPSNVSYYLNNTSNSKGESKVDTERSPVQVSADDTSNVMLQSSCKSSDEPAVQASEILAALQEILERDDMLKAVYRILCHGDGRRFKSLLSLPANLRKDWLLMEMKASED